MALRCFLFSSDEGASDVIRQVLTGLGVEGETCSTPTTAVEKVANEPFQLVVIDWDQQPEASMLLTTARERKASERPLTLAIVSDDASVPTALQAGANSILRKPLVANQVRDTLTTARDLLRSREDSAAKPAQAAAASAGSTALPTNMAPGKERTLRAGEFLQSGPASPGGQFVTDSEGPTTPEQSVAEPVDLLKDLEPVASAVPQPRPVPPPPLGEPRGLEWYLKQKGIQPHASAPAPQPPKSAGPELLGYDQTSQSAPSAENEDHEVAKPVDAAPEPPSAQEQKKEAELFAYIAGDSAESTASSPSRLGLGRPAILVASILAACTIVAAPQAPWHPRLLIVLSRGQRSLHAWLNPQPVTTPQAPATHEDFGRAGDEYKLPVAENIPDATTDPSQIQVLPAVDPTAKKPASDAANTPQTAAPTDGSTAPSDAGQTPAVQTPQVQVQPNPPVQTQPETASPSTVPAPVATVVPPPVTAVAPASTAALHTDSPAVVNTPVAPPPTPPKRQPTQYVPVTTKVPSSLQSQMAVMMPEASGNKPAEAAMPSIEPVAVPELTERALLLDQPALNYPASAKGQQGTVILQVLIGRDGTVQDAKFMQGSLAFARAAIDGVKLWQFKPYQMNGRPVSVQTQLTIKFKPAQ